jgi:hypothetical protein
VNFDREKYYRPGTNKTTKFAKEIFKNYWDNFSTNPSFTKLDHKSRLEFSRDYINYLQGQDITDPDFLKSMRRSFASRIGRQGKIEKQASISV